MIRALGQAAIWVPILGLLACPRVQDPPPTPTSIEGNTKIESFQTAKRHLKNIYRDHRTTLYCGCSFDSALRLSHKSCGYRPFKDKKRAARLEWEHVVPAHAFGQSLPEWRNGHPDCVRKDRPFKGRRCAEKVSRRFRRMQADMYNLYPAVGEVNGRRSNYRMAEIPGEARIFGDCDFEIEDRKAEPAPHARGVIARTYMYMDSAYPKLGIITKKSRRLFDIWSQKHPITRWECERAKRIEAIQGNQNPILEAACR